MNENLTPRDELARALAPDLWDGSLPEWSTRPMMREDFDRLAAHLRSPESVERAARALAQEDGADPDAPARPGWSDGPKVWQRYASRAHTSINALLGGEGS